MNSSCLILKILYDLLTGCHKLEQLQQRVTTYWKTRQVQDNAGDCQKLTFQTDQLFVEDMIWFTFFYFCSDSKQGGG